MKAYVVEEAYEVIDAIDRGNDAHLVEELGDLLLQVVFHAQLASEEGRFGIDDVIDGIVSKITSRHPHVFGDLQIADADQVLANWEKSKTQPTNRQASAVLAGVPRELPALLRARRIQEKASRFGFDWERIEDVFAKVDEEMEELRVAIRSDDHGAIEDEMGDLLFALANLSRFLDVCPEDALRKTIARFIRRFSHIEKGLACRGKGLGDATLEEMEDLWKEAKRLPPEADQ